MCLVIRTCVGSQLFSIRAAQELLHGIGQTGGILGPGAPAALGCFNDLWDLPDGRTNDRFACCHIRLHLARQRQGNKLVRRQRHQHSVCLCVIGRHLLRRLAAMEDNIVQPLFPDYGFQISQFRAVAHNVPAQRRFLAQ